MKFIDVKLWEWFPSNDELALKMGRLCILREDLMFELDSAIKSKNVPITDEYGHPWRLLYFFRKMSVTLKEIHKVVEGLSKDRDFKIFSVNQSTDFKNNFDQLKKKLELAYDIIKDIRNNIGAHIIEKPVKDALQNMSPERSGVLQISPHPMKTHYKFTGELLLAVMLRNVPIEQEDIKANEMIEVIMNAVDKLFYRIDLLFFSYANGRNLLKCRT